MSPRHTWPDSLHTFEKGRQNRRLINEERDVREAGSLLKHRLRRISRPVRSFEESFQPVATFRPSLSDTSGVEVGVGMEGSEEGVGCMESVTVGRAEWGGNG